MKKLLIPIAAALYAGGAIFTFGLIWNRVDCRPGDAMSCEERRVMSSVVATIVWPLSLSAVAQENGK